MALEWKPATSTHIDKHGRIVIPAEYRRELGVECGDKVLMRMKDGRLEVYTLQNAVKRTQEMMKQYQKYVLFEQKRQTLRTRARRSDATPADITAYADLLMNMGDTSGALAQYENAYGLNPKDAALRTTLKILYRRLVLTERLAQLEDAPK